MLPLVDHVFVVEDEEAELDLPHVLGLHGPVLQAPVDAAAEADHGLLHDGYVLLYPLLAELTELVGGQIAAPDSVGFLHGHLGGQAVAVPSLGEVDVVSLHPLEAGPHVEVGPVEDVPHVKVSAGVGGRRVYAVPGAGLVLPVVPVGAPLLPEPLPLLLVLNEVYLLG